MTIEYATYDPESVELVCFDCYAEAVVAAEDSVREIWLMVDAMPVLGPVPDSFERLVIIEDGRELRSAVLRRREITPTEPVPRVDLNRHTNETYGGKAPLLTINEQNGTVQLRQPVADDLEHFTLLWPFSDELQEEQS